MTEKLSPWKNDNVYVSKLANSFLNSPKEEPDSVLVYGPQGCGKTRSSLAIATAFGLRYIKDKWTLSDSVPLKNTLILTSENMERVANVFKNIMSYEEAMKVVRPLR